MTRTLIAIFLSGAALMLHAEDKLRVYIGTYTVAPASVPAVGSQGIYLSELDLATGKLTPPVLAAETGNPSFLALHPSGKFLYAAAEIWAPKKAGAVNAFAVNPATGLLTLLNSQSAQGAGTCHVSISPDGKYALAANYGSGSVCALPIGPDGKLGEATAFIQHAGQMGPNKSRQEGPHAHSINMDAAGKLAFAADLGMDKIFIYKLDPEKGTLTPNDPPYASVAPGSGPRHFAFHPNGRFAYIINEMANTVTAFSYDAQKGALTELQTLGTLPADFTGKSHCAEVVVHPSGKFLYGSNRGHDSIAIFKLDEQTGKLTAAGQQPSGGKNPRNFNVTPDGKWLLAAHQDTNNICVFKIDDKTGALMPTDSSITVSKAVRVLFAKP